MWALVRTAMHGEKEKKAGSRAARSPVCVVWPWGQAVHVTRQPLSITETTTREVGRPWQLRCAFLNDRVARNVTAVGPVIYNK